VLAMMANGIIEIKNDTSKAGLTFQAHLIVLQKYEKLKHRTQKDLIINTYSARQTDKLSVKLHSLLKMLSKNRFFYWRTMMPHAIK
jgi:hypothetical protein